MSVEATYCNDNQVRIAGTIDSAQRKQKSLAGRSSFFAHIGVKEFKKVANVIVGDGLDFLRRIAG